MDNAFDTLVAQVANKAGVTAPSAPPVQPKPKAEQPKQSVQPTVVPVASKPAVNADLAKFKAQPTAKTKTGITAADYPLAKNVPEKLKGMTGKTAADITIDKVMDGSVTPDDIRITGDTLRMQADVAQSSGKRQFADSLRRAAEMTVIPDERVLEMYNMLRPNRSTKKQLMDMAAELENEYGAKMTAEFVRGAAEVYEKRNILIKEQ